jgi:hypothetical protein
MALDTQPITHIWVLYTSFYIFLHRRYHWNFPVSSLSGAELTGVFAYR